MLGENTLMRQGSSSLPLQVLVYTNWHFAAFFFLINICLFTYKAVRFYYPSKYLGWELTTVFLYIIIELTRLLYASKGNKTSQMVPLALSLVLALPIIVLHAYYIELQTYVLRVDVVINAIGLFLVCAEFILSIVAVIIFFNASRKF